MEMDLLKLYEVPKSEDPNGGVWYSCLKKSFFTSSETGWAIGAGQVIRTVNNNPENWLNLFQANKRVPYSDAIDIFPLDENICGLISVNSKLGSRLCMTADGGMSWTETSFGKAIFLNRIYLLDAQMGWLLGNEINRLDENLVVYQTNNGGKDWHIQKTDIPNIPMKAIFFNAKEGLLLGGRLSQETHKISTQLLQTKDGGKSWSVSKSFNDDMFDFQILNEKNVIVVGERGKIFLSDDDRVNWRNIKSKTRTHLNAVHFKKEDFGIAVGDNGVITIIKNGETKLIKTKSKENFLSIQILQDYQGYLTSDKAIYRFTCSL